jgi:Glycosyl transferase family 90
MATVEFGRRRILGGIATIALLILLFNLLSLTSKDGSSRILNLDLPGHSKTSPSSDQHPTPPGLDGEEDEETEVDDVGADDGDTFDPHPIPALMREADQKWRDYESARSTTFRQAVEQYRVRYGRHPPPGFNDWYKYARERNVFNIDDFDQVMDDLRPFWALEPKIIRQSALQMTDDQDNSHTSGIHIRKGKVWKLTNKSWRSEALSAMIERFVEYLPDMDIAMNRLDQPRTVVPWEDMQDLLARESETRALLPATVNNFTQGQAYLLRNTTSDAEDDPTEFLDPEWLSHHGSQYMELASLACPPESPARSNMTIEAADATYKHHLGRLITNFNRSSDLCTVGPAVQNLHGFLYSASTVVASKKLLPVFGECKVNVNSDILFPAIRYYDGDRRYSYAGEEDLAWEDKKDIMLWRGVPAGGVAIAENWSTMHRQRLIQLLNSTYASLSGNEALVVSDSRQSLDDPMTNKTYENVHHFQPARLAKQHTDAGFTETCCCVPGDCPFYQDVFTLKPQVEPSAMFRNKYLIDVDGHSFSGRWHTFLESKSLAFKATIFREWHDSRLFAWRHFVPVDTRYDDLYSLLTYFIGYGKPGPQRIEGDNYANGDIYMPSHEAEGKQIARQGRDWARKVLRKEDAEVYTFRLLLEYGRVTDDNRDRIGFSGEGSELDRFDDGAKEGAGSWWRLGRIFGKKKPDSAAKDDEQN